MMNARRFLTIIVATLLVAVACQAPRAASTPAPSAAAGSTAAPDFTGRTVYILYGAGLADLVSKKMKVSASAQSTPASVDNMKLIRDGKADLAFTLADVAFDAANGKGRFAPPEGKADVKTLAVMYTNFMHIIVKDGSGLNAVTDLKGKRVSIGAAGSGTEIKGTRVLEAYGLSQADISVQRLGVQDSADALRDGKLDAFFWDGGLPTGAVADLAASVKLKFLDHADGVKKMAEKYGSYYFTAKIPKGTYKNDSDVTVVGVANLLVANSSFDPKFAAAILQTLFDNQKDLEPVHPEVKNLKLETAVQGSPIDYHPGAIEFYKARGVWKP